MLKINDIKPIVDIPDYSIYIYYSLILLVVLFIVFVVYFLYRYFKEKNNKQDKEYLDILKNLDFTDPKQTAYDISHYGRILAKSERSIRLIEELHHDLEEFKYKKNIDKNIPTNIKAKFDTFLGSLDV